MDKTTHLKPQIEGVYDHQIIQDTGSGGSYPVSADRVVWSSGAEELLKSLNGHWRAAFQENAFKIIREKSYVIACSAFSREIKIHQPFFHVTCILLH